MRWPRVREIFQVPFSETIVFQGSELVIKKRWEALRNHIVERVRKYLIDIMVIGFYISFYCLSIFKNIRVIAKFYTHIRIQRLTELLDLTSEVTFWPCFL
jgi:hypothetical protein